MSDGSGRQSSRREGRNGSQVLLLAGWVIAASSLVVCSGGGSAVSSSTAPDDEATPLREATSVLRRYVEAVSEGNAHLAMSLRCRPARVSRSQITQWTDEAQRLIVATGPLSLGSVAALPRGEGPTPSGGLHASLHVSYRIVSKGHASPPLIAAFVKENDQQRICGYSTADAGRFHQELPESIEDLGRTDTDLRDLLPPDPPGPGYVEMTVQAKPDPDMVRVESRSWMYRDYGGAIVEAFQFRSAALAESRARAFIGDVASDVIAPIGGAGATYLGYAWLWVQPPDHGPFIDRVVILAHDVVVLVGVSNLPSASDHHLAIDLATAAIRRMNVPGG